MAPTDALEEQILELLQDLLTEGEVEAINNPSINEGLPMDGKEHEIK